MKIIPNDAWLFGIILYLCGEIGVAMASQPMKEVFKTTKTNGTMKKVMMILMMVAVAMTAAAQVWEKTVEPGDELKGTQENAKYKMTDSIAKQAMAFYQPGDYWKVGIGGNVFQPDKRGIVHKGTMNMIAYATIGFYDENNKLVKKWDKCMVELTNGGQVAEASTNVWGKTSNGSRDVVPYLMNERGWVRIIIPTFRGKEFDMKVPCVNNK